MKTEQRTATDLQIFDGSFPFYRGNTYYTRFKDGLIYYSFESRARCLLALRTAHDIIVENNLNLKAVAIEKKINHTTEFHLIITMKNYFYDPSNESQTA